MKKFRRSQGVQVGGLARLLTLDGTIPIRCSLQEGGRTRFCGSPSTGPS